MENQNRDIIKDPVYLSDGITFQEFDSADFSMHYLLIINNKHYKITNELYLLVKTIEEFHTLDEITQIFSQKISQPVSSQEVVRFINNELVPKSIIKGDGFCKVKPEKSYLYLKKTLFSEKMQRPFTWMLQSLFNTNAACIMITLIFITHYYAIANYWGLTSIFDFAKDPFLFSISFLIIGFSCIFHEFGHTSACRYYGIKGQEIGFGLYMTMFVFYSNITECWRLNPKDRCVVNIAGIYFQFILNIVLFLFFLFTNQIIFIYAMKIICIQAIFSLNPFLRFDGYWLATDLLGIPNLRKKSTNLFSAIVKKYLKKQPVSIPFLADIKMSSKIIFFFYAIVSNLFILIFIVFIYNRFPNQINQFLTVISILKESIFNNDYSNILLNIYQFVMNGLILFFMLFFGYRIIKPILKFSSKLILPPISKGADAII